MFGSIEGFWDRNRIEQVFINLLTNAMKYGNRKPIFVGVETRGENAFLEVRDLGVGIAEGDRQRIFRQFERAPSSMGISGLGLGLFIANQLVDAHGGKIRLESEPGKGSTFVVDLPLDGQQKNGGGFETTVSFKT